MQGWPISGKGDGITMMIAAFLAKLFRNGHRAVIVLLALSLPQFLHLQLFPQLHSPSLQQHWPFLPHSHLFSLLHVQFFSHLLSLQQHSPALQQFESLPHLPSLQQSSVEQVILMEQHLPRRKVRGRKPMQPPLGVVCAQTTFPNRVMSAAISAACQYRTNMS